jgi:hypothetical protein
VTKDVCSGRLGTLRLVSYFGLGARSDLDVDAKEIVVETRPNSFWVSLGEVASDVLNSRQGKELLKDHERARTMDDYSR